MTSRLGARPPAGSCSQMANKETTRGKCAACFFLLMRSGWVWYVPSPAGNLCPSVPPHPHPPLKLFQSHTVGWWLFPLGSLAGGARPSTAVVGGTAKGPFCFGRSDLAVPAVQNTRAPAPLPAAVSSRPCADSTAHQLAAIYLFFNPPSHPLPSLCLSQKQQRRTGSSSDASLLQSPAKNAGPKCVLPRKPCLYPPKYPPPRQLPRGEGPALLWSPAVKMLSQPLEHLAAASLSALRAKPRPSREMG